MLRKKAGIILSAVFVVAFCVAASADFNRIDSVPLADLFAYDRNLPFNVEKRVLRESPSTITYEIYYDSSHNQRVPAVLTVPKREGPHPVIIFMHGHGMKKDLGPMADVMLAQKGYAMFGIDVEYRNERSRPGHDILSQYIYSSRDAFIQTIVDNMRGIDYLETVPEVDTSRIGVMGLSMGTFIGSVLFSLDGRIRCAGFGVGGANWKKVGEKSFFGPLYVLKSSGRSVDEIFSAFSVVDPLNYVHATKGRPVMMVNGRLDELVPAEAALALYNGFQEPKTLTWFDGGHVPSMETIMGLVNDMFDFFRDNLKPKRYHKVKLDNNRPPVISDFQIEKNEIHQNERFMVKAKAEDPDDDIAIVKVSFDCGNDMAILFDNGKSGGDEKEKDGIFTGRHLMYEKAALGKSLARAVAVDRWGETSGELTVEINVLPIIYPEGSRPPEITKIIIPESVSIGDKVHFEVHASDPDGDLAQILITITEIGLTLSLPPEKSGVLQQDFDIPDVIPPGIYHFKFQAKDRTKRYSGIVEKVTQILAREQ